MLLFLFLLVDETDGQLYKEIFFRKNTSPSPNKKGLLFRQMPGVYTLSDTILTIQSMFEAIYLKRKKQHIGYTSGSSFAFELGLIDEIPHVSVLYPIEKTEIFSRMNPLSFKHKRGCNSFEL